MNIKYGLEPVYEKEGDSKLLYGYIVSKCYVLDSENGYTVLFPYALTPRTYKLEKRRTPKDAVVGFNTNYLDKVYDYYEDAKMKCNLKNLKVIRDSITHISLGELEYLVKEGTTDMKITEKECIKFKKLKG